MLTEEHEALRQSVAKFAHEVIAPVIDGRLVALDASNEGHPSAHPPASRSDCCFESRIARSAEHRVTHRCIDEKATALHQHECWPVHWHARIQHHQIDVYGRVPFRFD